MAEANGFTWTRRAGGDVVVSHHGRVVTVLRGRRADSFVEAVGRGDDQAVMARVTGNYKRGNERDAGRHPRSRGR